MEDVARGVRRLTAPNPSAMTHTGTQSYVVGQGSVAVIDPGPAHPGHLAALLGGLEPGERVAAILVTHTHVDHSPGAARLAAETGAPTYGFGPHGAGMRPQMQVLAAASGGAIGGGEGADRTFAPDHALSDGAAVEGEGWRLEALHTPGHLSNHLAFALAGTGVLFTGDAVMGWATTLVSPPEGDMAAQMETLAQLAARAEAGQDRIYLPGHGPAVTEPGALVSEQRAHRARRRADLLEALAAGPDTASGFARRLYRDVDAALLPMAARNVLATLLALEAEGAAAAEGPLAAETRFRLA